MFVTKLVTEEWDVETRLWELFGVTREEMRRVVLAAVTAKNDAIDSDPSNAAGTLAYIYGTRELRELLGPKGYLIDRTGNVEATYDPSRGRKIIYQNTTTAADERENPQAISGKGPAAKEMVNHGQPSLFREFDEEDRLKEEAVRRSELSEMWFLCVFSQGGEVRAELSHARKVEDRQFHSFYERIWLIDAGDWHNPLIEDLPDDDVGGQDFDPQVSKK